MSTLLHSAHHKSGPLHFDILTLALSPSVSAPNVVRESINQASHILGVNGDCKETQTFIWTEIGKLGAAAAPLARPQCEVINDAGHWLAWANHTLLLNFD